jgi:hypothetical protein
VHAQDPAAEAHGHEEPDLGGLDRHAHGTGGVGVPADSEDPVAHRVRSSTQVATATSAIQMNTVIFTSTPAMFTEEAKTPRAVSKPSMLEMDGEETPPPISRVRPRFRPVNIRNVARVTMKLGSLVFMRIQPLMKPMPGHQQAPGRHRPRHSY